MSNSLFDIYQNAESAKAPWESLESKYMVEDASATKFLVSNFINYKMVDTRPVMEQYHEMLRIVGQYTQHNLMMDEAISVADDEVAWSVDSGVTSHVCKDLHWFQVCKSIGDGSFVKMRNVATEPIKGIGRHNKYVITFIDDASRYCYVYLLHAKHEALDKFKIYRGGEYYDPVYLQSTGIIHQTTALYTSQQNGVAERKNGTLKEMVDSMLSYSGLKKALEQEKLSLLGLIFNFIWLKEQEIRLYLNVNIFFIIKEDPRTLSEAMASRDLAFWKKAVQSEIVSIMHNDTLELTDLPPRCKALGCKWILKRKIKVDGSIDKYKARLVIQGFRQKERIDFFDTYAPVARISTIRLFKFDASRKGLIICLYMDDMLIFGTDQDQVNKTKEFLSSKFDMKDLGEVEVILGNRIKRGNNGTLISQLEYSRAIGCLMYAMINTRPDITFAVGKLSRYTSNPSALHWQALGRVFQYLKGTIDYGLTYSGYPSIIEGYFDASWINNIEDHSSASGWILLFRGGAIS
nr:zinc finger, CCHC-type [Tanacetum cinerariifolium]